MPSLLLSFKGGGGRDDVREDGGVAGVVAVGVVVPRGLRRTCPASKMEAMMSSSGVGVPLPFAAWVWEAVV